MHLDGARLFNAVVASNTDAARMARDFDSVSICLSKGLGAPVGSVLAGKKNFIEKARRWRKMLGGGMRQAGFLAAAGLYALDNNIERLELDHLRARNLAVGLSEILGKAAVSYATNMVFIDYKNIADLGVKLRSKNILISGNRLVVHLDINDNDIEHALTAFSTSVVTS